MNIPGTARTFDVIGENIHTTRVLLKKGQRFTAQGDEEAVRYVSTDGQEQLLRIPDSAKDGQDYAEGRIKHVKIAIQMAMEGGPDEEFGLSYLAALIRNQEVAGADFLDLNVDEASLNRGEQEEAMAWLTAFVQSKSELPISVDETR